MNIISIVRKFAHTPIHARTRTLCRLTVFVSILPFSVQIWQKCEVFQKGVYIWSEVTKECCIGDEWF